MRVLCNRLQGHLDLKAKYSYLMWRTVQVYCYFQGLDKKRHSYLGKLDWTLVWLLQSVPWDSKGSSRHRGSLPSSGYGAMSKLNCLCTDKCFYFLSQITVEFQTIIFPWNVQEEIMTTGLSPTSWVSGTREGTGCPAFVCSGVSITVFGGFGTWLVHNKY